MHKYCWAVISTSAMLSLPFLMFKANQTPLDYRTIVKLEMVFLPIAIINIVLIFLLKNRANTHSKRDLWVVFGAAVLSVFSFQMSNQMMYAIGIVNESRSIYVSGLEFHHINYGIIGVICLPVLFRIFSSNDYIKKALLILSGLLYGMIWDQWLYYMYKDVSDQAYMLPQTYVSAGIGLVVSYLCWQQFLKLKPFKRN